MANNRIQIKRSATTAAPSALLPGELAFSNVTGGSGVLFIGDTSNSTVVAIGGVRNPGVLTANQALVANSTSGIDKVITANLVANSIWANGSAGSAGQILASNSTGIYWSNPTAVVAGSTTQVQFNDGGVLGADAGFTFDKVNDALTVNGSITTGDTGAGTGGFLANDTIVLVGNNTINTSISATSVLSQNSTGVVTLNPTSLTIGNSSTTSVPSVALGNSTVNSVSNSSTFRVAGNTTTLATASLSSSGLSLGNDSVTSTTISITAANSITNVQLTPASLFVGNSTVNSIHNSGTFQVTGNTTTLATASLSSSGLTLGNGTVTSTSLSISAANSTAVLSATPLAITLGNSSTTSVPSVALGNSTVNVISNSSTFQVTGNTTTLATAALSSSGLALGNSTVTSTSLVVSVANTLGNVQITPISMRVANSTAATFIANATQITIGANVQLSANGGVGSQGQVLASNGTTGSPYWTTPTTGTVTGVTAGNGLFSGGTGAVPQLDVGIANGILMFPDAVGVLANGSSGLLTNATGVHIKTGSGLGFDGTGNLQVTGIISVSDLTVSGNLTVLGDLVSLNVATLTVEDSMITLAKDQSNSATFTDALDIGFFGTYGNTANAFISGLFRDQSDSGIWKLFTSNGTYTNAIINTANTDAFKLATLQSYLTSGAQFISNATSVYVTANSTVNVNISANVLSLSGRANNDLLFTNGTGGVTGLALGTSGYVVQSNGTAIVYDWLDGGTF